MDGAKIVIPAANPLWMRKNTAVSVLVWTLNRSSKKA